MIYLVIIGGIVLFLSRRLEAKRQVERQRQIAAEQERQRQEAARMAAEQRQRQQEARELAAQQIALKREQMRQAREQERMAMEQAKQAAQLAKHEKRIADLEFRMKQAEADITAEKIRIDHYYTKLLALDDQIKRLDDEIEYCKIAMLVARENKARADREKLRDKVFGLEDKIRFSEKRMAKAMFVRNTAEQEITAA